MKFHTSSQIRRMFLDYFKEKNHMIEPGASLVPIEDPSLLWINSGVSALKKYFDGSTTLQNPRIANSQRSLRTNDIENVGMTARHHTMFEMLGNFSIGDYFKKEAIEYAWEFLTSDKWIGLDKDKMYVTVYTEDDEAYDLWHKHIGLDDSRIFKLDGNFWQIGNGPCGPNSELFYDRGLAYDPDNIGIKLLADDMDNDRYIEVWNIVFSQFNAQEELKRSEFKQLPQKNIDTGMGLERLVSIVQNAQTNFETDLFLPIISEIEAMANVKYEGNNKKSFRVIADHIRAITFTLADGAMFSNEGRGYVLKRLLRRASRFGLEIGIDKPFLYKLVYSVVDVMNDYYPYLIEKADLVSKIIKADEERFHKTLASGLKMFEDVLKTSNDNIINGEQAFRLYDTYGFPIEIVLELSAENNYTVDMDGFNKLMENQKEMARSSFKDSSNMQSQSEDLLKFKKESTFVGYNLNRIETKIIGLFKDGVKVDVLEGLGEIIFEQTVFYAQSGGQTSDKGYVIVDGIQMQILDVKKAPNNQHLHVVETMPIKVNKKVTLQIDSAKRLLTSANHTATHLLHETLKQTLGDHIEQAGSYVTDEYLRFDFNHYEKVSDEDLLQIEKRINDIIFLGLNIKIEKMSVNEAKQQGARALFSDKYGDEVRVIKIGDYSMELCGGTHVKKSSDIGLFKIEKEESVGSGIRRIVAKTSRSAYKLLTNESDKLNLIMNKLGLKDTDKVNKKIDNILLELEECQKELKQIKNSVALHAAASDTDFITYNNINYYIIEFVNDNISDMKVFVDQIKNEKENAVAIVYSTLNKMPYVVGTCSKCIDNGVIAKDIAKLINDNFAGKGGGKLDMAQGAVTIAITKDKLCNILEQNK